MENPMN